MRRFEILAWSVVEKWGESDFLRIQVTAQLRQVVMVDDLKGEAGANCWNDRNNQRDMCAKQKGVVQEKMQ